MIGMDYNAAWAFAQTLGQQYGRPVVTGIGLAEVQDGQGAGTGQWYVRVDIHDAQGDGYLVLWDGDQRDEQQVQARVAVALEVNKQAMAAEDEKMHAAYARKVAHDARSARAKAAWARKKAAQQG